MTFCTRQSAMAAIADLHEKRTLPGVPHALQVKLADSEQRAQEDRKLFVGMLPRQTTEDEITRMFSPYGNVENVFILRNHDGESKGCAFVTYSNNSEAASAIQNLHQSTTMQGCRMPLVVKTADNDRQKQQRRFQRQQPMGQFGMNPMQQLQQPQQPGFGNFGQQDMQQAFMGLNQFAGTGYGQQPYGQQGYGGPQRPAQKEGPDNANLFIYHLPQEFNDAALASTFMPFGNVISSKVFVDKMTGQSKCFGFVSYDNPQSAHSAIAALNGFAIGGKRLKVQIKQPKRMSPY